MTLSNEPVSWLPRDRPAGGRAGRLWLLRVRRFDGAGLRAAATSCWSIPSAQLEPGDDVVFMREDKDGTRYVLIKRLVKVNEQSWTVKQYNPAKTFTLSRKEWSKAHLVIGKYNRAS